MFKVAKSFDTTNESADIRVVEVKIGSFGSEYKKRKRIRN